MLHANIFMYLFPEGPASKLSLKGNTAAATMKQQNKENSIDPSLLKTPEAKPKISAALIFNSCKKLKPVVGDLVPGHTILVSESSDDEEEEFIINGSHQRFQSCLDQASETATDSPLVEYSLIRKWLQNVDDSFSSEDDSFRDLEKDEDLSLAATVKKKCEPKKLAVNSPLFAHKFSEKPSTPAEDPNILAEETIILSSDDEADKKVVKKPDSNYKFFIYSTYMYLVYFLIIFSFCRWNFE